MSKVTLATYAPSPGNLRSLVSSWECARAVLRTYVTLTSLRSLYFSSIILGFTTTNERMLSKTTYVVRSYRYVVFLFAARVRSHSDTLFISFWP